MKRLIVNGCSYMNHYAQGNGHHDLANSLGIHHADDLSFPGSCNDRIIRTTLRDSYHTDQRTFYILGMTFLNRTEMPILKNTTTDGRWKSFQNFPTKDDWAWPWTDSDTKKFIDLFLKSQFLNMEDRIEDLMYKLLALVSDLRSRGHRVLIFQQAEDRYQEFLSDLKLFDTDPVFVDGFRWCAVPWQLKQGALPVQEDLLNHDIPGHMLHIQPNQHQGLNEFLLDYVKKFKILE